MTKTILFCLLIVSLLGSNNLLRAKELTQSFVEQSERKIPIVKTVDVAVIGGTSAAVAAAVSAAKKGASVYLVASRPYLGEDLAGTLRLRMDKSRKLGTRIEQQIFGEQLQVTPLKVKATLNQALIDENIDFIFGSFVTDVIKDEDNNPAGVIIANRAGRQTIAAKAIIDATNQGWVCRMAGAKSKRWEGDELEFKRTIILSSPKRKNQFIQPKV